MIDELRITNYELRITNWELRIGNGQWGMGAREAGKQEWSITKWVNNLGY